MTGFQPQMNESDARNYPSGKMLFKNPIFKTAEAFPKFLIEISYNITK